MQRYIGIQDLRCVRMLLLQLRAGRRGSAQRGGVARVHEAGLLRVSPHPAVQGPDMPVAE